MKVSPRDAIEKSELNSDDKAIDSKLSAQQISDRAYHAWLKRGCTHGFDVEDWLEAERQLLSEELLMSEDDLI